MRAFRTRLAKLERDKVNGDDAPTLRELRAALAISERYYRVWATPRLTAEAMQREDLPSLSDLSPEDRDFVVACEAGELERAREIDRRYRLAHGYGPGETTKALLKGLAE